MMKIELQDKRDRLGIDWRPLDRMILKLTEHKHVRITLDKKGVTATQLRNACYARFNGIKLCASASQKYLYISLK